MKTETQNYILLILGDRGAKPYSKTYYLMEISGGFVHGFAWSQTENAYNALVLPDKETAQRLAEYWGSRANLDIRVVNFITTIEEVQ